VLLAIDPGRTTGLVVLDETVPCVVESGQLSFKETLWFLDAQVRHVDFVVAERYDINARTAWLTRQMEALLVIGAAISTAELERRPIKLQGRSDAKTAFSDAVLRRLAMYDAVTGPHARDALRHGLLAVRARVTPQCARM
jgi:hypothetical protein